LRNRVIQAGDARALLVPILAAGGIVVVLLAVIRVLIVIAIFGASLAKALLLQWRCFTWITGFSISRSRLKGSFPASTGTAELWLANVAKRKRPKMTAIAKAINERMGITPQ